MNIQGELQDTITALVQKGKGILAADESSPTIAKRFQAIGVTSVVLEHIVLKPNMMVPGKQHPQKATAEEVAVQTIKVLRRTVPAAVPSINFLSGGLSPEVATSNLNAMNQLDSQPWELIFSYGRALQEPALQAWKGEVTNAASTQSALLQRARLNGAARYGEYSAAMESAHS